MFSPSEAQNMDTYGQAAWATGFNVPGYGTLAPSQAIRRKAGKNMEKPWHQKDLAEVARSCSLLALFWCVCVCEFVLIFLRSPKEFTVYDPGWLLFYRGHFLGFVFFWGSATLSKAGKFDFGETYPETDLRNRPLEFDCAR